MATPPDGDDSPGQFATIKVMTPAPQLTINFVLPLDLTIRELKDRITQGLESRPAHTHQRLIYRGKILQDEQSIGGVLKASANGEDVGPFSRLTNLWILMQLSCVARSLRILYFSFSSSSFRHHIGHSYFTS